MKLTTLARTQFAVKLAGAVAVVAYCISGTWQQFSTHWYIALLTLALEVMATLYPFVVNHNGTHEEFTPDMMMVVAAALLLPTRIGALVVSCGYCIALVLKSTAYLGRIDDATSQIFGAFLALAVGHLIGSPGLRVDSIAGAAVAGLTYEMCGSFMFTLSHVLLKHVKFWSFFGAGVVSSVITYPWLICLGVLLGVTGWDAPWALPLMAAPLALVFMASRSRVQATEDRTHLDGLLKATTEILAATATAAVTEAVSSSIAPLFETQAGRIDTNGPREGELGVTLQTERLGNQYLVVPARNVLVRPYTEDDRRLLETLASVTASALDKAALHEDVAKQATRDALTGLANRRAFEDALQSRAIGKRSTDTSGVMFLDLDGFKKINDEHGHNAGDEVLIETAKRLLQSVRDGDTVARLGGDEFTILLRGVHNKGEAAIIAERILVSMRQPFQLSTGICVHPTPSLGIALATGHVGEPAVLLKDADNAMYEAKRAGKNCWRLAQNELNMVIES